MRMLIVFGVMFVLWLVTKTSGKMKLSDKGKSMLIALEGVMRKDKKVVSRLSENERYIAYKDAKGLWTAGVGTLIDTEAEKHLINKELTASEVLQLLNKELVRFEDTVRDSLTVPVNQAQFDALVIFAFNVGQGGFKKSNLLQHINNGLAGNDDLIKKSFLNWTSNGLLTSRRQAEIDLFNNQNYRS